LITQAEEAWALFPRPFGPSGRHQTPRRQTKAQPLTPTANRRPTDTQTPTTDHQPPTGHRQPATTQPPTAVR